MKHWHVDLAREEELLQQHTGPAFRLEARFKDVIVRPLMRGAKRERIPRGSVLAS
jgi:hypothetical protein